MKKSSSSTSKFSTSFASHKKSDIKGVSLINELNQIIEVGTALGCGTRKKRKRLWIKDLCLKHKVYFLGVQGSKMTRLDIFRLKITWGNFAFDYACSMPRGHSGGILSVWDPYSFTKDSIWCDDSFIIFKGKWNNSVGSCYMVNIYAPQDQTAKYSLWNRLKDFMHHNDGSYIFFGDINVVRNEQERYGSSFNSIEADHFNAFIESKGLIDLPIGGRSFTWMNKAGTKLSKLDCFLFSNDVTNLLPDIRLLRDGFDDFVKSEWNMLDVNLKCHDKFRRLKANIRQWSSINKTGESNRKVIVLEELSSIEKKIDDDLNEIKETIWDCGSSKAPSPDGYTFAFVKKFWGTIHKDLHEFVDNFFTFSTMPHGANSSFFTLIPKVNNPTCIMDFRLISLIGIHYKIIAKILANRLAKVIDKIISKEQSTFIADRQILDGPLILTEIIESCLISSRALILVNGSPTFEFFINRGLRQGDPLSPFLFILIMDGLHNALANAMMSLLLLNGMLESWRTLFGFITSFTLLSGLQINIHKSNIYSIEVNDEYVSSMAHNVGCISRALPFIYLVLPIGSNMNSIRMLSTLNSFWVKAIKVFHGQDGGFDYYGCKFKGSRSPNSILERHMAG
uniref:RNA-directed DNA polymerase, eukaryota, reverse transcriptase zinc-binding domain protein n=1 Tax=Tanacetum cinerariifolium TaxID=118510 RepID=A0A699H155_TANCI|nr:RNA-directed DNA polymerase, eukaryota, reverse transcriptase zinc-binding domain protein [Tanacetum cinerariifolium]